MKNRTLSLVAVVLTLSITWACVPFVEVLDVKDVPADEKAAAFNITIYEVGADFPKVSKFLGQIKATSCKHWMWDDAATTGNALEQLRIKAHRLGADAIVHVACDLLGTNLGTNCWASVSCSGDAVRFK